MTRLHIVLLVAWQVKEWAAAGKGAAKGTALAEAGAGEPSYASLVESFQALCADDGQVRVGTSPIHVWEDRCD